GEPGAGKSRLADELGRQAAERGARVVVGRCWEAGGAPPYWPWVQALGRLPEPPELDTEGARFRLFQATSAFLRASAEGEPLLHSASVLGREFGLDALAEMGTLARDELLDTLDEAMAERIVVDAPAAPGQLRFGHALIRDTLYDDLTSARRLRLHLAAGEALEAVYAGDPEPHLAELAHHFRAAAPVGATDRAVAYSRRAGDRAIATLAFEEAERQYEAALILVDDAAERCELLLGLGEARARAGDTPASKRA